MILYEVTLHVEPALVDQVEEHMRRSHIPAIFATGCFQRIRFCHASPDRFRTSYEAETQADLDRYFRDHAPGLRNEFTQFFPTGVSLSRETLVLREVWDQVLS
jgi:Domain of unknown function (DUF4286)